MFMVLFIPFYLLALHGVALLCLSSPNRRTNVGGILIWLGGFPGAMFSLGGLPYWGVVLLPALGGTWLAYSGLSSASDERTLGRLLGLLWFFYSPVVPFGYGVSVKRVAPVVALLSIVVLVFVARAAVSERGFGWLATSLAILGLVVLTLGTYRPGALLDGTLWTWLRIPLRAFALALVIDAVVEWLSNRRIPRIRLVIG